MLNKKNKLEKKLINVLKKMIDNMAYSLQRYLKKAQTKPKILLVLAEFNSSKL